MKKTLLITFILPMLLFLSCKKDEVETAAKEDKIVYAEINKTIREGEADTLIKGCYALVCSIDTANLNKQMQLFVHYDSCVGGIGLMISGYDNISLRQFAVNDDIGINANWTREINLNDYKLDKDIFIGIRDSYYSWLRLRISEDKKELRIIDMAKNVIHGNAIKAGQIE